MSLLRVGVGFAQVALGHKNSITRFQRLFAP